VEREVEMKQLGIALVVEVIRERAEKGGSFKCAVCCKDKKTFNSRTCPECQASYSGIAKVVDQATENYFIKKLNSRAWQKLQQEIAQEVSQIESGGQKCPDELIVKALRRRYQRFALELCESAVRHFRKWQKCLDFVSKNFDIDQYYKDKNHFINKLQKEGKEFTTGMIFVATEKILPAVRRKIAKQMEKLAYENIIMNDLDLKNPIHEKAVRISKDNGGIYGYYRFSELRRAVAERMRYLEKRKIINTLGKVWVVCHDIASEAVMALQLSKAQISDQRLIRLLPKNALVVESGVEINNLPLFELNNGKLVKVGPCRKATRAEQKASSEFQHQQQSEEVKKQKS